MAAQRQNVNVGAERLAVDGECSITEDSRAANAIAVGNRDSQVGARDKAQACSRCHRLRHEVMSGSGVKQDGHRDAAKLDDDLHGVTGSDTRDGMEGYQWRRLGVVVIGCGFIVFMIGDFHGEETSADPVVAANVLLITIEALAIVAAFLDFGRREAAHGASGHRNSPGRRRG